MSEHLPEWDPDRLPVERLPGLERGALAREVRSVRRVERVLVAIEPRSPTGTIVDDRLIMTGATIETYADRLPYILALCETERDRQIAAQCEEHYAMLLRDRIAEIRARTCRSDRERAAFDAEQAAMAELPLYDDEGPTRRLAWQLSHGITLTPGHSTTLFAGREYLGPTLRHAELVHATDGSTVPLSEVLSLREEDYQRGRRSGQVWPDRATWLMPDEEIIRYVLDAPQITIPAEDRMAATIAATIAAVIPRPPEAPAAGTVALSTPRTGGVSLAWMRRAK